MDLIYTNTDKKDVGVLQGFITFDLAFGADENDFELKVDTENHCCSADCFVYIENTEYGGIIDSIEVNSDKETMTYMGRTWHGVLSNKILCPDVGQDYLTVSGEANTVIGALITRVGLSDIFMASEENSGIQITSYQFYRYTDAYSGIRKMLTSFGAKLKFMYVSGKVVLSAAALVDYTKDEQFSSDLVSIDLKKVYTKVNHVVCLGRGDLKDREVIHLYSDKEGNIGYTKSITGINEVTTVYDYANAESTDDLEQGGIDILKEAIEDGSVDISFDAEDTIYDIDDMVGAKESITGIEVKASITKKIVTIENNNTKIKYEVG